MLGLKLNHVSKRGHWWHIRTLLIIIIILVLVYFLYCTNHCLNLFLLTVQWNPQIKVGKFKLNQIKCEEYVLENVISQRTLCLNIFWADFHLFHCSSKKNHWNISHRVSVMISWSTADWDMSCQMTSLTQDGIMDVFPEQWMKNVLYGRIYLQHHEI